HQWYVAAAGFDVAVRWATAIGVEQALARRGNGPVPAAELLGHRYLMLMDRSSHALAQIHLPDIAGAVVVCFTAADRAEEFLAGRPPAARPLAEMVDVTGPQLFEAIRAAGASGLVVNAGSDDQTALAREDIAEIVGVRA